MSLFAAVDLNWLLQIIVSILLLGGVLVQYVKVTASKFFLADEGDNDGVSDWAASESSSTAARSISTTTAIKDRNLMASMGGERQADGACAVCGDRTTKHCSACKMVSYCSEACQRSHWQSEHKAKCKHLKSSGKSLLSVKKVSDSASGGSTNIICRSKKILFPYEEFMDLFNWDKPGFPPCGLLNCGNSCFANVVLQCLAYTKPLVAFLLEKGHRRQCRRNDWCFLCEFQAHVERASQSSHPFSPINILSRLPNIGGNLGYGKQEDAHEFMRFAIDTMQSVCLDMYGGEKALHPSSQETTLIQHIFGGHLQSQVICTKCNNVSNQFENMMDLTVEIHGDAASLEECLDQFTAKEWLHGDNMYKCDRCNDYVMAWKRLTILRAPNILTIALKRFQSGRFGKLNKRVAFPETLNLSPYMSEGGEDNNIYKLYAVIVHVDMLNASFFGHYICYIKDFRGNWYRIDDCKVYSVDLDEVLSQGAYMLLYSRICARSSSLYPTAEILKEKSELTNVEAEIKVLPLSGTPVQCDVNEESIKESSYTVDSGSLLPSEEILEFKDLSGEEQLYSSINNSEDVKMDFDVEDLQQESVDLMDIDICEEKRSLAAEKSSPSVHDHNMILGDNLSTNDSDVVKFTLPSSTSRVEDGGQTEGATEYSSIGSYDAVTMVGDNHVDGEESLPVNVSSTASRSGLFFNEPESTISRDKTINTLTGDPQACVISGAAGILDGEQSGASSNPMFSPDFLDKQRQKESTLQEGEVQTRVLGGNVSARVSSNVAVNGNGKMTLPCSTSVVEDDTGGARECFISDSYNGVPMVTDNHVDAQENVPVCVPSVASTSDVVFNEQECSTDREKELNTSSGHPLPSMVPDAAGMPGGRRSGARSESSLSRGFLDKGRPKKSLKQVGEVHTMLLGDDSSTRVNSNYSDVTKSILPCSTSLVENRNRGHLIGDETESFSDSYNAVPVVSNSDANLEGVPVSEFSTASNSSLAFNEPGSTDNKKTIVNASSGDPQPSASSDAAALLDGRHSGASSKTLLPRGFLDKSRPRKSMKQEAEVDTMLVGNNSRTKMISNDSDTSSGVATEYPIGDSYQEVPVSTDNDADMEERVPVSVPSATSTSGADFDESESTNNKEKRMKTPNGDSQPILVPDAAGRSTAIKSRTRSEPFLFPGFLDKSRPKKSNKQGGEAIGLRKRASSSSKLKSSIDGVAKFDSFGQNGGSVRSSERSENGHCSHNHTDLAF